MNRISLLIIAGAATFVSASAASAADLLINQPAPSYGGGFSGSSSTGGWDGAYVGAFAGYGWGTLTDEDGNILNGATDETDLSGWTLGATLGANFSVGGGLVLGAAGDVAWSGIGGFNSDATPSGVDFDVNWTSSLRARAGYDAGAFMPYLTGGLAVAGATVSQGGTDNTQVHIGWTAGGGVEVAATEQISLDLQYRYSDYGQATYDLDGGGTSDLDLTTHAVTAGVNFKF
ncbi:MAG: outer membrane protein [Devosia sp.]